MDITRLRTNWNNIGRVHPLRECLTAPTTPQKQRQLDQYLRSGAEFCAYLQRHFAGLGVDVGSGRALDFGCGHGRVTQGLGHWLGEAVGVDLARSIVEAARALDRSRGRCRFLRNETADLRQFSTGSFDFATSVLTLQHMRPELVRGYLRELLRVVRPGGHLYFQLPAAEFGLAEAAASERSRAPELLPFEALRGAIAVHPGHLALPAGGWHWFRVHVHNQGDHVFRTGEGAGKVQVAARWHNLNGTPTGKAVATDLPFDLPPGGTARFLVPVQAPREKGHAMLQLLITQGGVWMETAELAASRAVVNVLPAAADAVAAPPPPPAAAARPWSLDHAPTGDEAEAEFYCVPVAEVVALLQENGGEVLDVAENNWAGPGWISASYTVRKR